MHERSKKCMYDVELYGGKTALLVDDINRYFSGLWQVATLAYTLAFLTVMVSGGIFLAARYLRAESDEGTQDEGPEGGG
jgi:hypothetical protein